LVAIIPPGNYADKFPKAIPNSTAHTAGALVANNANELYRTILKSDAIARELVNRYSKFFTAHFGANPIAGIYEKYFLGKTVSQGSGAGNTNAIAQEIFSYTNPTITEYGGTRDTVSMLILAISQTIIKLAERNSYMSTNEILILDSVYELEYRPHIESLLVIMSTSDPVSLMKARVEEARNTPGQNLGDPSSIVKFYGLSLEYTKTHPDGYEVQAENILSFYKEAAKYQLPGPFWNHLSKFRLTCIKRYTRNVLSSLEIHLVEVDPATGAPKTAEGSLVAEIYSNSNSNLANNPDLFLSSVRKKLFPEMYLLNEGMTISADARQDVYSKQLANAASIWQGIPNKQGTPMAVVITESFNSENYATNAGKAYAGKETSLPVRKMQIYLQPAGIESAMRRLLDQNDPAKRMQKSYQLIVGSDAVDSDREGFVYKISRESVAGSQEKIREYIGKSEMLANITLNLLSNPKLYIDGKGFLDRAFSDTQQNPDPIWTKFIKQNMDITDTELATATSYFASNLYYSGWPTTAPVLLFEAPIDDESDLKSLINMFKNYMIQNAGSHPETLKIPEPYNAQISANQDTTHWHIKFPVGVPLTNYKPPKSYNMYSYQPYSDRIPIESGRSYPGTTTKYQHYYLSSKGLLTGKQYGTPMTDNLPVTIDRRAKGTTARTTMSTSSSFTGLDNALMIGGSAATLAAIIGGVWYYNRNQSP
jgi:hypothetical protein